MKDEDNASVHLSLMVKTAVSGKLKKQNPGARAFAIGPQNGLC